MIVRGADCAIRRAGWDGLHAMGLRVNRNGQEIQHRESSAARAWPTGCLDPVVMLKGALR